MIFNFNEDFQYDSCISRGICSPDPRVSSLQKILVLYLKTAGYYALKLYNFEVINKDIKAVILNTISILVSNPDFSETDFKTITQTFNSVIPTVIDEYTAICESKNIEPEYLNTILDFSKKTDIIKSIQAGEKVDLQEIESVSQELRDMFKILLVIAKSICTNILDLETLDIDEKEGYYTILEILDYLNNTNSSAEELKKCILHVCEKDNFLSKKLHEEWEKRFGKQEITEVSYSTFPGKAMLVVGSNIKELEDILEALKDKEIDVYTHDEMMLAHTYKKFKSYKHLKGQYGQGLENCLLDFATFPGPIILTRHSLYNVEHLYRGRLYTTDFACSKGVVRIDNKDFSGVIDAAENSKGFKTGKHCESVVMGYSYEEIANAVREKLSFKNQYKRIFIIGLGGYSLEQQAYYNKLFRKTPDDVLILTLANSFDRDNIIHFNMCFDNYAIVAITELLNEFTELPITLFFPSCSRSTIAQMIYLKQKFNPQIYVSACTPITLNPNLIQTLSSVFSIKGTSSVKRDLEEILAD